MNTNTKLIKSALSCDLPLILWGQPGTGKTAFLRALAKERGAHIETLIGSTLDPVAVAGLPVVFGDRVKIAPPDYALRLRAAMDAGIEAWLFFDEISCAPPSVQAALLRIVHERVVDGISLAGCRMIAASNPADTAADGGLLSAAAANRWIEIDWRPSLDEWTIGELTNWGRPAPIQRSKIAANVAAFLRRKQDLFLAVPEDSERASRAWPSPRSWSAAISLLTVHGDILEALTASVGRGAAAEFATYHASLDLPDPEEILSGKKKVPERGDQAYAVLYSLIAAVLGERQDRKERIQRAWKILSSVRSDIGIIAGRALSKGSPDVYSPEAVKLGEKILAVEG